MGKLSPSLKPTKLPLSIMKPPPSTSQPSPRRPLLPAPKKSSKTPKSKPENSPQQLPTIFKSPSLPEAIKTLNSLYSSPRTQFSPNSILHSFSLINPSPKDSLSLLTHLRKQLPTFSPDRETYHIILTQSCNNPNAEFSDVLRLFDLMAEVGFPPDKASLDIAVRSLCSVAREDDACRLLKESSQKYAVTDLFTYNFLIRRLCKSRVLSTVYKFIDEMRSLANVKPDLVTYTILIDNVCSSKNLREATHLLRVLSDSGIKPDCYLYNTIMKGHCILDRGGETLAVYKKMKEEGVQPDLVTYNTLIFGLSKAGLMDKAKEFLGVMVDMGHFPDTVTYTSLMNGMCRKGKALEALAMLSEMEERCCTPNSCTYNTLLHGLCKAKYMEKAMELYGIMKSEGMKLDAASYATFVRMLCRDDRIAEAYEVFDYALESKSLTDVAAYAALESTLKWVKKMKG